MPRPREFKVMHAVACPACGAVVGAMCRLANEAERATAQGRLFVHGERRTAWQTWRRTHTPDYTVVSPGPRHCIIRPAGERQRAALLAIEPGASTLEDGAVRVADLGYVIDRLTERGWHVGGA